VYIRIVYYIKSLEMKRLAISQLAEWKTAKNRKPLIIQGARQVGKTWIMKEFAKQSFKHMVYLNFESSARLKNLFVADFDIDRIISIIEIEANQKIDAKDTLLIFDEIQEAEKGLTALKYFYEKAPKYFIVAAGSVLGIAMQHKNSFPVGKVDFIKLHPLSFFEFLQNIGEEQLLNKIQNGNWDVVSVFHDKLIDHLRLYYFTGGMPEAVADYITNKNLESVRTIQDKILLGYENDFAKHVPHDIIPRVRLVWNSLLGQLAKENRKFMYGLIKTGARAKDFEMAISWLADAGLIIKVNRVGKPKMPLTAHQEMDAFKLFMVDIGLLNAMAGLDAKILLEKNTILTEFKGALTEQFVCQQLHPNHNLFYWSAEAARAEIDFIIQSKNEIIPIEVKAEENLKAKSLKVFVEKFKPKKAVRTSMSKYRQESWLVNWPLYAIEALKLP